jgi:predicted nucleic acid-binding protein
MKEFEELSLALDRWQKDEGCDRTTALREFTKTPRGQKLWDEYVKRGDTEGTVMLSSANITDKHHAMLRRLKAEADEDGKGIRILDSVTGETLGMAIPRREMQAALDALDGTGPRMLTDLQRHKEIGRAMECFEDDAPELAVRMAEHFDQHPELDPKDAHHLATAMREVTKADPQLWRQQ